MNFGIHSLRLVKPVQARAQLPDEEREEIRARGNELFSGRTINWDKLGVFNRLQARFSSEYEGKVREEFKGYVQEKLIKNMNGRVQTYLNNNLNELKASIRQIKDLSLSDIKDLNLLIKEKEVALARKYFAEEKEKFIADLIERGCLSREKADAFVEEHAEFRDIASLEKFSEFRTAVYETFQVPLGER